jgi:hypothetical protein
MAYVITSPEYLEIDGLPLSTPAWDTTNMDDMWASSEVRGDDLLIPMATGVRPFPRRPTVTEATVELAIYGDTAPDGTPQPDQRVGLASNCDLLRQLTSPTGAATDGTRFAVLHMAPGSPVEIRTGRVHVVRLRISRTGPNYAVGSFELSLPGGALT